MNQLGWQNITLGARPAACRGQPSSRRLSGQILTFAERVDKPKHHAAKGLGTRRGSQAKRRRFAPATSFPQRSCCLKRLPVALRHGSASGCFSAAYTSARSLRISPFQGRFGSSFVSVSTTYFATHAAPPRAGGRPAAVAQTDIPREAASATRKIAAPASGSLFATSIVNCSVGNTSVRDDPRILRERTHKTVPAPQRLCASPFVANSTSRGSTAASVGYRLSTWREHLQTLRLPQLGVAAGKHQSFDVAKRLLRLVRPGVERLAELVVAELVSAIPPVPDCTESTLRPAPCRR